MNKKDKNSNYYNIMEKVAEQNYKTWGFPNSDYALLHALNDNTYDYRGYYNKYPNGKGNAIDHWTDEFKTVFHPTFSKWSIYSGKKSLYNPKGIKGGSWLFEKFFIPSKDLLMNYFKKGGGIHIKKENRGKFTDYCGGKVTSECIAKGKNSPNAAIRKRATFADNARHFKHRLGGSKIGGSFKGYPSKAAYEVRLEEVAGFKKGGLLRFLQEGGKNDAPSSFWKFLNSNTGKGLLDLGKGLFSGISDYKKTSSNIDEMTKLYKASAEEQYATALQQAEMKRKLTQLYKDFSPDYYEDVLINNDSDAVKGHEGWENYSRNILEAYNKKLLSLKMAEQQERDAKGNALSGMFGSFVLNGLGIVGNIIGGKKTSTNPLTTTSTLSSSNYLSNNLNFGVKSIFGTY